MFFKAKPKNYSVNKIFVRDLIVDMHIGVFDHEKGRTQKVRVNIDATPLKWPDGKSDDIAETVSYDDFVQIAKEVTSAPHTHLVETIAERIAERCLERCAIGEVHVKIEKLEIYPAPTIAGVEIIRARRR